jgi:hypothetical protein
MIWAGTDYNITPDVNVLASANESSFGRAFRIVFFAQGTLETCAACNDGRKGKDKKFGT